MDKTNVKVKFDIIGEKFLPDDITEKLSLKPSEHWMKGDKIKNKNIERKETCWTLSTEYEESYDINDQLKKIVDLLKPKKEVLVNLKNAFSLDYIFNIVINVENNEKPAIYLDSETVEFAGEIKAEFGFDLYIF